MQIAEHHRISQAMGIEVYFCDPASPWQRGANENTNGLLRQYFPKGTDLSHVTPTALRRVEREINARARKSLGGRSAEEVFRELKAILNPHRWDDH
jgi:IS30 family transposase